MGLEQTIQHLIMEKEELRVALYVYGDHTMECYRAPTDRCICSWIKTRKRFSIKPRDGEE